MLLLKVSVLQVFFFFCVQSAFAQLIIEQENRQFTEEEIKEIVRKHLLELSQKKVPSRHEYLNKRIETIDSLLAQDSTNLALWNKRVNIHFMMRNREQAKDDFNRLIDLTENHPRYFFARAALHEYFEEFDIANSLYNEYVVYLESRLKTATTDEEEADYLLSLWYVFEYLGEEEKAKGLIQQLYSEYYDWIAVGINPNFFNQRFGDAVFEQE
ncbi:MAG: hypothetical protein MI700_14165 [Balneolales bacterium]|nr:hypothetical protein [Balneolales bacterium]